MMNIKDFFENKNFEEFNGYYKVDENELISYYDIEPLLIEKEENVDINDNFDLRMHEYIDGNLSDTKSFYQELLASKYAREKFYNLTNAQFVFEYVSINNTKIEYGLFIQAVIDFLIVAFCIFVFIKLINSIMRKKEEPKKEEAPKKSEEVLLLEEIRDLLKKQNKK